VVPRVLPALFRMGRFRRFMFRTISQTAIEYRDSGLSEGIAGRIHGGDRLPWVPTTDDASTAGQDNFSPLAALAWQVHVYGDASPTVASTCERRGVSLRSFPWTDAAGGAGLLPGAVYVVRPDGYVGFADADPDVNRLDSYLASKVGLP
jgi:hypothetical protein